MNSKQRRKKNREKKNLLEKTVEEYSSKMMNDFCPLKYSCPNPDRVYEWKCFGNYHKCRYYNENSNN